MRPIDTVAAVMTVGSCCLGSNDNHRQRKALKALLVFEIAIDRDQKIERGCASRSNSPFLTPAQPASATVLTSRPGLSLRSARGTHSSSSTRIGNQASFRLLKRSNGDLACDSREVVKKPVQ
jgi:hypothetical protein